MTPPSERQFFAVPHERSTDRLLPDEGLLSAKLRRCCSQRPGNNIPEPACPLKASQRYQNQQHHQRNRGEFVIHSRPLPNGSPAATRAKSATTGTARHQLEAALPSMATLVERCRSDIDPSRRARGQYDW
jgi:hypothetical protein